MRINSDPDPDPQHCYDYVHDVPIKGIVSRDCRLQVFFHESVSPKPLSVPLGPFRIFEKIRNDPPLM